VRDVYILQVVFVDGIKFVKQLLIDFFVA